MCLAKEPQRSDAGETRTRSPSVSSLALYHWATALPTGMIVSTAKDERFFLDKKIRWYRNNYLRLISKYIYVDST